MKNFILLTFFLSLKLAAQTPLTIWTSNESIKKALTPLATKFANDFKHPVEINILNKDLTSQFKTAALTNKGPDIFLWAHDVVGELAESGLLAPIQLPKKLRDQLLPVALEAFSYKGQLYGYPYDLEAVAFFCHKKLVPKIPETFEQLLHDYASLQNPKENRFIFLYDIKNFFFSFPFIAADGGYIFKNTAEGLNAKDVGLANSGAQTGFKFIRYLAQNKFIPTSTDRSIAFGHFKEGKVGCTIDGPWALADLRAAKIPYSVSTIPKISGKSPRPFIGAHGLMIRRTSPNLELAQEFIEKYVMTKAGQLSLYQEDPRGPTQLEAIKELSIKDPDLRAFLESAKLGIPMPNIPAMGPVWGAMGTALTRAVESQDELNKILQDAQLQILVK